MHSVEDLMASPVITVCRSASVAEAAKLMAKHNIGSLIVVPEGGGLSDLSELGIVTERDILVKVVAKDMSSSMLVSEVMTKPLNSIDAGENVKEAVDLMSKLGIRRLPVSKNGAVVGILSSRDVHKVLRFSSARGLLKSRGGYPHD